ncbi:MAG: family 78 glycoside hydrolase catalytic domain [Bacillota bacterium]|nr:family 78 glycoside hydrolase catalytic domain [Bacillota bacterium]
MSKTPPKNEIMTIVLLYLRGYTVVNIKRKEWNRMKWQAKWIRPSVDFGKVNPVYRKKLNIKGKLSGAELVITAMGVYEAAIDGKRVGDFILAPGWTSYSKRHQYQTYDITDMLSNTSVLEVTVGEGWYRGRLAGWIKRENERASIPPAIIAQIELTYADGSHELILTDKTWEAAESPVLFSNIYDGEVYDARHVDNTFYPAAEMADATTDNLIPQQGEKVTEHEHLKPLRAFVTPKGEKVIDFGQNLTGYVAFTVNAKAGERVVISCAETLDADGNFYNANYRSAKSKIEYTCKDGVQFHKPSLTFFGFRYIRLDEVPSGWNADDFTAIALYSDMKRTGHLICSDSRLNRLFDNIVWGQKSNFLDVPTDCPQRDERLGWTGDAQVFCRTATYNFDAKKFFEKWLADLAADQGEDGYVPHVVPDCLPKRESSAAWGDAAVICPWQVYLTYGDTEILKNQFESMKLRIKYIGGHTSDKYLWTGAKHFGDWLGLDSPEGSYKGSTRADFIASAYYAYTTSLVVKAGKALGADVSEYEALYENILKAFRKAFSTYKTQTEHVLALYFDLAEDKKPVADSLAKMIRENGNKLKTGFVGTPYLLHALSDNGHADVAYSLLLQDEFPSWLYSVKKGATTIWEHWDGVKEDGSFWSTDMNSFNHYAYGSVGDWVYGVAAGIRTVEEHPGFERVLIKPIPDERLSWLCAELETKYGTIRSKWTYVDGRARYEIDTPSPATIVIGDKTYEVEKGSYIF